MAYTTACTTVQAVMYRSRSQAVAEGIDVRIILANRAHWERGFTDNAL